MSFLFNVNSMKYKCCLIILKHSERNSDLGYSKNEKYHNPIIIIRKIN